MSYQGYEQLICVNGHYSEAGDIYEFETTEKTCPHCTGAIIWFNIVDETNGSFLLTGERIDNYIAVQEKEPAVAAPAPVADIPT